MVMDYPVEKLIEEVGKDHRQILHPGRESSMKYRGHHIQDLTEALLKHGWVIVMNYARYPISHPYFNGRCLMCGGSGKFKGKWEEGNLLIKGNKGVLQYGHHSCAWDGEKVYDPAGQIYDFHTTNLIGFHPMFQIK